jgi:hypothetical protein
LLNPNNMIRKIIIIHSRLPSEIVLNLAHLLRGGIKIIY